MIAQERYQQPKCLSHKHQRNLCHKLLQSIQAKITEKMMAENAKQQLKIDANREVVALICHKLQKQNVIGEDKFGEVHLEKCMVA
jgi:hypothetical protein